MCRYRSSLRLSAPQNATERREMPALLPGSLRRVQAGWHCLPGPPMETLRFLLVVKVFHRIRLLHAKSIMTADSAKQKSSVVCESCAFSFKVCAYFRSFSIKDMPAVAAPAYRPVLHRVTLVFLANTALGASAQLSVRDEPPEGPAEAPRSVWSSLHCEGSAVGRGPAERAHLEVKQGSQGISKHRLWVEKSNSAPTHELKECVRNTP